MEALLILNAPDVERLRAEVERRVRVTHMMSPRLLVVTGEPSEIEKLAISPDIVSEQELARGIPGELRLTPEEELFVKSWLERRKLESGKERPGEGLNWGSKGFEPP
jgi:hypothetical protein